jgi:signal transduction histidine kinase/ActR/RegA family two-component response regulator
VHGKLTEWPPLLGTPLLHRDPGHDPSLSLPHLHGGRVMQTVISALFEPSAFSPHGFCPLWEPGLIWLHALSDGAIGIAYFSIPLALLQFARRRPDLEFGWILWLFAAFILACGTTHFLAIVTLWAPLYWLDGAVKMVTALVSVATAVLLWPLLPRALALPSPTAMRLVNEELSHQIEERDLQAAMLREREAQLRQSQKIEAIGRLTGGIAHDFNNMLTVIIGNLDRLRRRLPSGETAASSLVMQALDGADRAGKLTHRLLAFARQQSLAPVPLDANRMVASMSDLLRRTLGESYRLETVLAADLWLTEADANQLENALLNLAVNARDAMPDGGRLTIETANAHLDADYAAKVGPELSPGEFVLIAVTDTGTGMTPEIAAQAFEPFFTTKPVGLGTGLGLSQVFGFVKQTKGHVAIESEPGQGTAVRMYFPRYHGPLPTGGAAPADAVLATGQSETILLVEDDPSVRSFTAAALVDLGYCVKEADSAPFARTILDTGARIDLLLTDVVLPGDSGRVLADAAVARRPGLPVLFISGYARDAIVHNGVLDPGVHLLRKPFSLAQLAEAVQTALAASA